MKASPKKSAFIAIVGRPNTGKSSLLNAMIGRKVSIVSKKPQTTRTRVTGILTRGNTQFVFIDTPGLLKPRDKLGDYMVKAVDGSVAGVDACILVTQAGAPVSPADLSLIERFRELDLPVILAINKIDLLEDKTKLLEDIQKYSELYDFDAVVPLSAKTKNGIDLLFEELEKQCIEGDFFFPEDEITDQPDRMVASEMIREKVLRLVEREVPHGVAVSIERFSMREDKEILDIEATIICEKNSHKGILIGKGGEMLKQIGTQARLDLERFFGCKVSLGLWVKVKEDWRNRTGLLMDFGYDSRNFDG